MKGWAVGEGGSVALWRRLEKRLYIPLLCDVGIQALLKINLKEVGVGRGGPWWKGIAWR